MTSILHAPPRTVYVNLGLSEDLIRHFLVIILLELVFPTVHVHSGCLLCILTAAMAVLVTCFFRNWGAFWER
jgi:hypothetical protein